MKLRIYGESNIGNGRRINEDQIFCDGHYRSNLEDDNDRFQAVQELTENVSVFAVFDGMGGLEHGEKASALCAAMLESYLDDIKEKGQEFHPEYLIGQMNESLLNDGGGQMGSTAVMAICNMHFLLIANIGDSRAYLMNEQGLQKLSVDHTVVESNRKMELEYGISVGTTGKHKHILTQHIGIPEEEFLIEPHIGAKISAEKGNQCLLCSDGLTDKVSDLQIAEILSEKQEPEKKVRKLMRQVLEYKSTDNTSIILMEWQ